MNVYFLRILFLLLYRLFGILFFVYGGYLGFRYSLVVDFEGMYYCLLFWYYFVWILNLVNLVLYLLIILKFGVVIGICIIYWLYLYIIKNILYLVKYKWCIYCFEFFYLGKL